MAANGRILFNDATSGRILEVIVEKYATMLIIYFALLCGYCFDKKDVTRFTAFSLMLL